MMIGIGLGVHFTRKPKPPNLAVDTFAPYGTAVATRELVTEGEYAGWYKVTATRTGSYGWVVKLGATHTIGDIGVKKTFKVEMVSPSGNIGVGVGGWAGYDPAELSRQGNIWSKEITSTNPTAGYYMTFVSNAGAGQTIQEVFYYRDYQIAVTG